jgi:hypothetical protein
MNKKNIKWNIGQKVVAKKSHPEGYFDYGIIYRITKIRKATCACLGFEFMLEMEGEIESNINICELCSNPHGKVPANEIWFNEVYFENRKNHKQIFNQNKKRNKNKLPDKKIAIEEPRPLNLAIIQKGITTHEIKTSTLLGFDDLNSVIERVGFSDPKFIINEQEAMRLRKYYKVNYSRILKNFQTKHKPDISISKIGSPIILIPTGGKNKS